MNKPRVYFWRKFWRVSPMPRPYWKSYIAWSYAHKLADWMNDQNREQKYKTGGIVKGLTGDTLQ